MSHLLRSSIVLLVAVAAAADTFSGGQTYLVDRRNPNAIVVADFNGDGRDDVAATEKFCASRDCGVMLFLQTSDGVLAPPVVYDIKMEGSAIQAGHFNDDARIDLAIAGGGGVHVFPQQADGGFDVFVKYDVPQGAYDLASGDVNGDFRTDIAAMTWGAEQMHILEQQPGGAFAPKRYPMRGYGYDDFDLSDLDGDGRLDAINAAEQGLQGRIHLNYGKSDGTFGDVVPVDLPWKSTFNSIESGDLNGDGRTDLAVITNGTFNPPTGPFLGLLYQNADGTFETGPVLPTRFWPKALLARDLDRDGDTDLVVAGGYTDFFWVPRGAIEVWVQIAPGIFEKDEYALPRAGSNFAAHDHLATGDMNSDGRTDLVVSLDSGAIVVFHGKGPRRRSVGR